MNTEIVAKLRQSLTKTSLKDIAQDRRATTEARSAFLLLDCSGSMAEHCEPSRPKITALRELVDSLRAGGLIFTQVIFPGQHWAAEIDNNIYDPCGGTPMHAALEVANIEDAKHAVIISDGMPDDEGATKHAAAELKKKSVKIDVFYVGPYPHPGEKFLRSLATMTGGKFQATTLSTAQKLKLTEGVKTALLTGPKR